jgi:hypothetical protein
MSAIPAIGDKDCGIGGCTSLTRHSVFLSFGWSFLLGGEAPKWFSYRPEPKAHFPMHHPKLAKAIPPTLLANWHLYCGLGRVAKAEEPLTKECYAIYYCRNLADPMAAWAGFLLHDGRVHPHPAGHSHRIGALAGYFGAQTAVTCTSTK